MRPWTFTVSESPAKRKHVFVSTLCYDFNSIRWWCCRLPPLHRPLVATRQSKYVLRFNSYRFLVDRLLWLHIWKLYESLLCARMALGFLAVDTALAARIAALYATNTGGISCLCLKTLLAGWFVFRTCGYTVAHCTINLSTFARRTPWVPSLRVECTPSCTFVYAVFEGQTKTPNEDATGHHSSILLVKWASVGVKVNLST